MSDPRDEYGQIRRQLGFYEGLTPEDTQALTHGQWMPERLAEFTRSRGSEEERLQRQIANAQQMAFSPMNMNTNSTPAAVASIVANALRSFGGMALAGRGEKQLADAQAESARQHGALIDMGEGATDAVKRGERGYLSKALEEFGGYGK